MNARVEILPLNDSDVLVRLDELSALLLDAVQHGASIGFTLPLTDAEVRDYWRQVAADLAGGAKRACAALDGQGHIVGSAQLALERRANGRHRAEVQKVMVRHAARGRGIGAALMRCLEGEARACGRSLLFLDTSVGPGGAVDFYTRLGYEFVGSIPGYAADPDGTLVANAIFYKRL